ncbi:MAG TPA: DsbA family oxidoreductase [Acetobacteraceae bacterium]|nr:DsbA family oxidoreductase [Acetobacteraceae bacterium]
MDSRTQAAACTAEGCEVPAEAPATALPPNGGQLDIVSDAICPWCWVGKANLDAALAILEREDGLRFALRWRPFQLNPDMPAEGVDRAAYRAQKFGSLDRSKQLDAQVAEAGRAAGVEFRHDRMLRTPNTVEAHRLMRLAEPSGLQHALMEAVFRAYFQEGRDIGSRDVLAEIGRAAGLDDATLAAFTEGHAARHEVMAEDEAYRHAGISGVPSFVLDRYLLWSGAMPAERMAEALRGAHAAIRAQRAAAE